MQNYSLNNNQNSDHPKSPNTIIPLYIDNAINKSENGPTNSSCCLWFLCWCINIGNNIFEKTKQKIQRKSLEKERIKINQELDAFNPVIFYNNDYIDSPDDDKKNDINIVTSI